VAASGTGLAPPSRCHRPSSPGRTRSHPWLPGSYFWFFTELCKSDRNAAACGYAEKQKCRFESGHACRSALFRGHLYRALFRRPRNHLAVVSEGGYRRGSGAVGRNGIAFSYQGKAVLKVILTVNQRLRRSGAVFIKGLRWGGTEAPVPYLKSHRTLGSYSFARDKVSPRCQLNHKLTSNRD